MFSKLRMFSSILPQITVKFCGIKICKNPIHSKNDKTEAIFWWRWVKINRKISANHIILSNKDIKFELLVKLKTYFMYWGLISFSISTIL